MTEIAAEDSPLEERSIRPEQAPWAPCKLALTVKVAGVVPAVGVTEKKLLQAPPETVAVNGDDPAVLATKIVWVSAFPAPPGPPPPPTVQVREGGFAVIEGDATTLIATGMVRVLLLAPEIVIVTMLV